MVVTNRFTIIGQKLIGAFNWAFTEILNNNAIVKKTCFMKIIFRISNVGILFVVKFLALIFEI